MIGEWGLSHITIREKEADVKRTFWKIKSRIDMAQMLIWKSA